MVRQIKFVVNAVKWFDKVNGNTYHSVRITRCKDNKTIVGGFTYGYGDHYQQTAMETMIENKWIPSKYNKSNYYLYERENKYPILWNVSEGLKRDCISNGIL
jgi:hypothetical protein